nr:40S ribosomal protein S29-like [Pogona vitticeps]
MGHQQLYWSDPRESRQGSCSCHVCANRKYKLNMCHQCFWQYTKDIGFAKLD